MSETINEVQEVTVEVISTELEKAVSTSGLELESAQSLKLAFSPYFDQAEEWRKKVASINVTSVDQVREMKLARETRLALKEIRVKAEATRKTLKEDSLRKGKAIDGIANVLKFLIEPLEERLLEQEQFAERQEAARKEKLKADREALLLPFGVDTSFYNLGEMPEPQFQQLFENTKAAEAAKQEAARKVEEERIAREKAEREERERIRLENERLKQEAAEREKVLKAEQERASKERAESEKAAAEERKKAEVERLAVEKKAREEREAREKAERELQAVKDKEAAVAKALEAAKRKSERAPEKSKIAGIADVLSGIELPEVSSEEGKSIVADIRNRIAELAKLIRKQSETL